MPLTWRKATDEEIEAFQPYYRAFAIVCDGMVPVENQYPYLLWNTDRRNQFIDLMGYKRGFSNDRAVLVDQADRDGYADWLLAEAKAGRLPKPTE